MEQSQGFASRKHEYRSFQIQNLKLAGNGIRTSEKNQDRVEV
jgi:hypothetical protein